MKKQFLALAVFLSALVAVPAVASERRDAVVGAIIGGSVGALIGHSTGGRDGAVVGSALGAMAGTSLAIQHSSVQKTVVYDSRPYPTRQRVIVREVYQPVYGHHHHYPPKRSYGHPHHRH